jgi:hypothetical protein
MVLGKVRERLSVSKQVAKNFGVEKYYLSGELTVICSLYGGWKS